MDKNFSDFLGKYNEYMKNSYNENTEITKEEIMERINEKYYNRVNMYDKICVQFPTIERFLVEFYCKVYIEGKQIVLLKTDLCNKCGRNYGHDSAATFENNEIIHKSCEENIVNSDVPVMRPGTLCKLCGLECKGKIILEDNDYFHFNCCVEAVKNNIVNWQCKLCEEQLFPNLNKHRMDYCVNKKDKSHAHVKCAKADKDNKYTKTYAHTSFNKCGICGYYIMDNKYIHNKCKMLS